MWCRKRTRGRASVSSHLPRSEVYHLLRYTLLHILLITTVQFWTFWTKDSRGEIAYISCCFQGKESCCVSPAGLIEQRDSQPLLRLIDSIGDWPVASDDWNTTAGRNAPAWTALWIMFVLCKCAYTHTNKRSYSNTCAHAEPCVSIFTLSELLSTSFVGGIKRPAEALQLSSQVWSLGAWWVGSGAVLTQDCEGCFK